MQMENIEIAIIPLLCEGIIKSTGKMCMAAAQYRLKDSKDPLFYCRHHIPGKVVTKSRTNRTTDLETK